ncbi:MAG: DNA polymerase III subunit delta' [Pseudomonadales bacterium]|nr:DNA polymerase III subunit delta' [Pseudomonadales bacterium]
MAEDLTPVADTVADVFPWQQPQLDKILQLLELNKLPHAMLLCGPGHLGKRLFAGAIASLLLCQAPAGGRACRECSGCLLFRAGSHPDLWVVKRELRENGKDYRKQLVVDQIRDLIHWATQTAQRSGYKVAIIHPAEAMNTQAANALLKCLEEPASNTILMLVTDKPARLLPTILSRCQRVEFSLPAPALALPWLAEQIPGGADPELMLNIAGGAPLAVVERVDDGFLERRETLYKGLMQLIDGQVPVWDLAALIVKQGSEEAMELMISLLEDVARCGAAGQGPVLNSDCLQVIELLSRRWSSHQLFGLHDRALQELRALRGTTNPNETLLMEAYLSAFVRKTN